MTTFERERERVSLRHAFDGLTLDQLRPLASLLEKPGQLRKAELITRILAHLKGSGLRALLERLSELELAAVSEVTHSSSPCFHATAFESKYGRLPHWVPLDGFTRRNDVCLLWLFFQGNPPRMSDELRERLRPLVAKPAPFELQTVPEPPSHLERTTEEWSPRSRRPKRPVERTPIVVRETEPSAYHDLRAVLTLVDEGRITVSAKSHQPDKRSLQAIGAVLLQGDLYSGEPDIEKEVGAIRAFAWPMILQASGLAKNVDRKLQLTQRGRVAFRRDPKDVLASAWQKWLPSKLFDELRRVESIRGQTEKGKRHLTRPSERRAVLARALGECPPGKWLAVDELFRMMKACRHDFLVTRDPMRLYFAELPYGSLYNAGSRTWHLLQARYALAFLVEYVATLGLIDVACVPPRSARQDYRHAWGADELPFLSRYDGLLFLRVNALGAWVLGIDAEYRGSTDASPKTLTIQPNRDVVDSGGVDLADQMILDQIAGRRSDHVWQLEAEKLLAYLEKGHPIAEVVDLLETRSSQPLPNSVRVFLEDVDRRVRALQDSGTAWLIECADGTLAATIASDSNTGRLCLLAGDHHLAVPSRNEKRFRTALKKLGYAVRRGGKVSEEGSPSSPGDS